MQSQSEVRSCKLCLARIPKQNYRIHSMRCRKKTNKCQTIQRFKQQQQQQIMPKRERRIPFSQFPKQQAKIQKEKRQAQNSEQQKIICTFCGYPQTLSDLDTHPNNCAGQYSRCQFCEQKYPNQIMRQHKRVCQKNQSSDQIEESYQMESNQEESLPLTFHRILNMLQAISSLMGQRGFEQQQEGLSEEQLRKLKRIRYKRKEQSQICTICYCQFQQNQQIIELKCHHLYHFDCISKWLQKNIRCPNCKKDQKN